MENNFIKLVIITVLLVTCVNNVQAQSWEVKTSRAITHEDYTAWKYNGLLSWYVPYNVDNPSRVNNDWDTMIAGDPDPWEKLYDTDHLPTPPGMGYWISSDNNQGTVGDGSSYDIIIWPPPPFPNRESISRATLWLVADDWADVGIWDNYPDFDPESKIYLGGTPHIADGGFTNITRIDMTEEFRSEDWPGWVPAVWFDVSNATSSNQHMGLFAYYSVDYSREISSEEPKTFTHVYNFEYGGWNYISMPLYLTDPATYPNCTISDIFDLTPGVDAYFFDPDYSASWIAIPRNTSLTNIEPLSGMSYADILRTYTFAINVANDNYNEEVTGLPIIEQRYLDNNTQGWHYMGTTYGTSHSVFSLDDLNDGSVLASVYFWNLNTAAYELTNTIEPFMGHCEIFAFGGGTRNHWDLQGNYLSGLGRSTPPSITDEEMREYIISMIGGIDSTRNGEVIDQLEINLPVISAHIDTHFYIPPETLGLPLPPPIGDILYKTNRQGYNTIPAFELNTYPNPFNSAISVEVILNNEVNVSITLYDISGGKITTLYDGTAQKGSNFYLWNGMDDHNLPQPSGVYLVKVKTDASVKTQKIILIK